MSKKDDFAIRSAWQRYVTTAPRPSREDLNEALASEGFAYEISFRMYDHFGRLFRNGIDRYMPINEFDIAKKNGRFGRRSA